jgi:hypothetical protein
VSGWWSDAPARLGATMAAMDAPPPAMGGSFGAAIGTRAKEVAAAAVAAFATALVAVYSTFLEAGQDTVVTAEEWATILLGFVGVFLATMAVRFYWLARLAKAVTAGLSTAVPMFLAARAEDNTISSTEWQMLAAAALAAAFVAWGVPNATRTTAVGR